MRQLIIAALLIGLSVPLYASSTGTNYSYTLSCRVYGVTLNGANTDQATFTVPFPKYIIRRISITNPSSSLGALSTATIGVFTGAGGSGTTVVTAAAVSGVTTSSAYADLVLALSANTLTSSSLTIRTVTSQGSAITADFVFELTPID